MSEYLDKWNVLYASRWWSFFEKDTWYAVSPSHRLGGAGCLVMDSNRNIALVKVRRRALDKVVLEVPRGACDPGETSFQSGIREGAEETGLDLGEATVYDLGPFYPDSGILAYELRATAAILKQPFPDTLPVDYNEVEGYEIMPYEACLDRVIAGDIKESTTVISVLRLFHDVMKGKIVLP